YEPINRFAHRRTWQQGFFGIDVRPVADVWAKVRALYDRLQPESDPMLDFDERDLFELAEAAGFAEVRLRYEAAVTPPPEKLVWERVIGSAGNPKIPTLEEAMAQTLTAEERERLVAHVRPLLESGAAVSPWRTSGPEKRAGARAFARGAFRLGLRPFRSPARPVPR